MTDSIMIDERTRIQRIDSMNWTVQELRDEPKGQRWRQANGDGHGPFAGRPDSPAIVACLLDNSPELDGFEGTLQEHAKAVDAASRRIAKSIAELNR